MWTRTRPSYAVYTSDLHAPTLTQTYNTRSLTHHLHLRKHSDKGVRGNRVRAAIRPRRKRSTTPMLHCTPPTPDHLPQVRLPAKLSQMSRTAICPQMTVMRNARESVPSDATEGIEVRIEISDLTSRFFDYPIQTECHTRHGHHLCYLYPSHPTVY